jgi:hypothetical protein
MPPSILIAAIVIWGAVTIYFAARSRDFRKFWRARFSRLQESSSIFRRGRFGAAYRHELCSDARAECHTSSIHFVLFLSLSTSASSGNRSRPFGTLTCRIRSNV